MTFCDRYHEVCEGFHRPTPPEIINQAEVQTWQRTHESSTAGLFASVFSYTSSDLYIGEIIQPILPRLSTALKTQTNPAKKLLKS